METITSRSNPKVKQVRALRQRKERQESGLFLVEGIRHIGEAVEAARTEFQNKPHTSIEYVLYSPELLKSEFALGIVSEVSQQGIPCYAASADVFNSLAEKENPQGILAVISQPALTLNDLNPGNFNWAVALVAPQDPGNLGTILRTVDAVGASGIIQIDSHVDIYHPSAVRASMGTIFWYPCASATFDEFTHWAARHKYHIYGTSARGSVDYQDIPIFPRPRILLMGSEREGLTDDQRAVCERLLKLPMLGRTTSLNLGVATGVFLYAMLEADQKASNTIQSL